jgi:very-short-patch-repair endonuclease
VWGWNQKQNSYASLTQEELRLWSLLRSRRFLVTSFGVNTLLVITFGFRLLRSAAAIELDGGQHEERYKYDVQRTVWLNQKGWKIIRFWNNELWQNERGRAGDYWRCCNAVTLTRPSPPGEGGKTAP